MSNVDITKLSREELEFEYNLMAHYFGKVLERVGGRMTIPADAWTGEVNMCRIYYLPIECGGVVIELRKYE